MAEPRHEIYDIIYYVQRAVFPFATKRNKVLRLKCVNKM